MDIITVIVLGVGLALQASGGTIIGKVQAQGKPEAGADGLCGKYDSREFKFVERVNYAALRDFVVYLEGTVGTNPPVAPAEPTLVVTRRIMQKSANFSPHVLPVLVGTTVEWPNEDEILHNVFSFSEIKPFDLGLYKSPEVKRVKFDRPGRVDVFCSIHARMSCIILVRDNPFFAPARDNGTYRIADVPPGTYQLRAWHERLPSQAKEVTVPERGEVKVDFLLGITNLPKPNS
jgi:plastocyanin